MPKPIRKLAKRGAAASDRDHATRYFTSAGRQYPPGNSDAAWLPFKSGEKCRDDWRSCRIAVRRAVSPRAFKLLSAEFDEPGQARVFYDWPRDELAALYEVTRDT